jgi:hypothetical protein
MGLYRNLLARNPSQSEVNFWLGVLSQGRSRQQIVTGIVTSVEYQTDIVNSIFSQYLDRTPTPVELGQYLAQIQSGIFDANVIGGLLASNAYFSQVTA